MRFQTDEIFGEFIKAMNERIAMAGLEKEIREIYVAFLARVKEDSVSVDTIMNNPIFLEMIHKRFEEELQMPIPIPDSLLRHLLNQILKEKCVIDS